MYVSLVPFSPGATRGTQGQHTSDASKHLGIMVRPQIGGVVSLAVALSPPQNVHLWWLFSINDLSGYAVQSRAVTISRQASSSSSHGNHHQDVAAWHRRAGIAAQGQVAEAECVEAEGYGRCTACNSNGVSREEGEPLHGVVRRGSFFNGVRARSPRTR